MPHSGGKITKPVSINDVAQTIPYNSNDVGRLCSYYGLGPASSDYKPYGINKWATFKPVKVQGIGPLSKQTLVTLQFGLNPLNNTIISGGLSIANAVAIFAGDAQGAYMNPYKYDLVAYTPPTGGQQSPYRLSDFAYANSTVVGYDKNAQLRYSYKDSNDNWHGIVMRYGAGTEREVSTSSTEVENLNAEVNWVNYSDAALASLTDANLTVVNDSILIHDLLVNYRTWNKGIIFMNSNSDGEIIAFVGSLDWSNQTLRRIIGDTSIDTITFEFLTNMSAGVYTYTTLNDATKQWVAIPGCGGIVKPSSGGGDYTIQALLGGNGYIINPESVNWYFDISAVITKINFDEVGLTSGSRKYVQLVLSESESGTTSAYGTAVNVYQDSYVLGTEIAYPLRDASAKGLTLYLNIVGKVNAVYTGVLDGWEITLGT